jgi:UDP-N-acetyl-D-galactosamine dehydrogenase
LILGLTFKENCPDVRNTKVVEIVAELASYGSKVDVWDPWVDAAEAKAEYGIDLIRAPEQGAYDVVVIAVAHDQFKALGTVGIRKFGNKNSVIYDVKYVLPSEDVDDRL